MSTNNSLLPKEAVALVQHIELNKTGWWEKAVHRLVLASVWLAGEPPDFKAIQTSLESTLKLPLTKPKLESVLASLESRGMLLRLQGDRFRIPEQQRMIFEKEIAESEKAEREAKKSFCKLVVDAGEGLDTEAVWAAFEHEFLAPLIKQVGANAYRFVAGEKMTADKALVDHFLQKFPSKDHSRLRTLVTTFLDPKKPEVCAHISRLLHARFCVEASGLPEDVLAKLNAKFGKQLRFQMFVDTNFLFSLLELHENPSNAAAQELRELVEHLKGQPRIELVITPETIDEAKRSISYTKGQLNDLPSSKNFTQAALQGGLSGMAVRFLTERLKRNGKLSADEWFDPYLNDFVPIARGKSVELFNENADGYSTRQDVVDDIHVVLDYEERLPDHKRKSYAKAAHDVVLWHFVNDKRPAYIESPIDANYWILTIDYRLIGFDEHKQTHSNRKIPLCIHPTSFIQLLQFWVPRTKEFEEAMLGSLRLPFLFQQFDAEGEKTSLRILKGIGRFEDSESLSQDTITHVMFNEGLRSRLQAEHSEEAEIALIRDTLVEEARLRAEDEANKAKALEEEVRKRDSDIATLADQKRAAVEENAQTKKAKEESDEAARQVRASQDAELEDLKARLQSFEKAKLRRAANERKNKATQKEEAAQRAYLRYLVAVIVLSAIGAWQATNLFPWYAKILGALPTGGLLAIIVFVLGHLLLEKSICRSSATRKPWAFCHVERFRKALWTIVILGLAVGVGGSIYSNWIQKNLDAEKNSSPATESKVPESPDSK